MPARRRRPPRPGALADLAPLRILAHIALLQLFYYAAATVLIGFSAAVAGRRMHAGDVFDWRNMRADVTTGWTLALCWMLDSLLTVIPILLLVARSKLVPDFAMTIHLVDLMTTSVYTGQWPTNVAWWLVRMASAALMISLGMWACQWRELRPMAFGGRPKEAASAAQGHTPEQGEGDDMGGRRGAGRDGAGHYEMVELADRDAR